MIVTYFYDNEITEKIKEKGKVHIYSHGDFDGICSAALFISAFVPRAEGNINNPSIMIKDVNYNMEKEWKDYPFDKSAFNICLDFPIANGLDLWVDHHRTGRGQTDIPLPTYSCFDENAPAAVHVLAKLINKYNKPYIEANKKDLGEYLHWAKVIDGANYDNVMQVMRPTDKAILFDLCFKLLKKPYDFFTHQLVRAGLDFDKLMADNPLFRSGGAKGASEAWKSFFYMKEHGECTDSGLIVVDMIGSSLPFARYAPWLAFEKMFPKICMTSYNLGKSGIGISLSRNPFLREWKKTVDLSKVAETFGGGGHADASGINCKNKEQAYDVLQKAGEMIEKQLTEA